MADWSHHIGLGTLLARQGDPQYNTMGIYCLQSFQPYHVVHYLASTMYSWFGPWWVSRSTLLVAYILYITSLFAFDREFPLS